MVTAEQNSGSFRSLYPFASQYFDVEGGRIHYLDEGPRDAPVLLMVHGNPTWSFLFRDLVRAFRHAYRVVVPDHLGCGFSDKPQDFSYTLEAHIQNLTLLVEHLGLKAFTLVLHDWGGAIGMGYAVRRPETVDRFVVFNTAAFPSSEMPWSIALCRLPLFGPLMIRGFNVFARAALWRCIRRRERVTPAVRSGYLTPYNSWRNRVANLRFVQDIPARSSHPSFGLLEHIGNELRQFARRPMLLIFGADDFVFNRSFFEEWKLRFPDAEAHYVEGAGHYVIEDAHERIVPWMDRFLSGAF